MSTIYNKYAPLLYTNGPGITEAADSSWVSQIHTQVYYYYSVFTFRCILFKDPSQATIANLLSEEYSGVYLKNRMRDASNVTLDFTSYPISINEMRLTNDGGVFGVTNSFAAALWALDISLEFAFMGGISICFYNPLLASNQSVFGAGPDFAPGALYYGLLAAAYALRDQPYVDRVPIVSGTSQSIKAYGLNSYNGYRILLINKDLSAALSGVVSIRHDYAGGLRCYYLSAPSLASTADISFAGMHFLGNSSAYAGEFAFTDYQPSGQTYSVKLAYAQAALCEDIPNSAYTKLNRGRSQQLSSPHLVSLAVLLFLLAVLY
jgi:hypothetical protein